MKKKTIWIFLGLPMCGKGSTGFILRDLYGTILWVMRDLIADATTHNTDFQKLAEMHEKAGTLVPDDEINQLLKRNLDLHCSDLHVLDGAGRNLAQMKVVIDMIQAQGVSLDCIRVIHFNMTEKESMARFEKKRFAIDRKNRKDADPKVHLNRIHLHLNEEPSVLSYLRGSGISICQVNAASSDAPTKILQIIDNAGLERPAPERLAEVILTRLNKEDVGEYVTTYLKTSAAPEFAVA